MKSYLSLVPISAKVRRRQNRMTILCIICAAFSCDCDFQCNRHDDSDGTRHHVEQAWKLASSTGSYLTEDIAEEICRRTDVTDVGASSVFNAEGRVAVPYARKKAVLYGTEETYL